MYAYITILAPVPFGRPCNAGGPQSQTAGPNSMP